MIKNINYTDAEVLGSEFQNYFHSGWFFVGLTNQLSKNNDYITYQIGSVSVFVQNFDGVVKCFSNICLHRFNNIHTGDGNGHAMCKYHSWVYNEDGCPLLRPGLFNEELNVANRNSLEEYDLEVCGQFIFVKVNKSNKVTLKATLGSFYKKLIDLSSFFEDAINSSPILLDHQANWKLLVENVLECYHCSSVHKETLVPIGVGGKKPENHFFENGNDKVDYPIRITAIQKERQNKLTFLSKTEYPHQSLEHWYIAPNLFITSTGGNLFYIARLDPIQPDSTQLYTHFIKPKYKDLTKREELMLNAYATASVDSSKKVVFEDREILEQIQRNINIVVDSTQIFGDEEFRIKLFHQHICNKINYI